MYGLVQAARQWWKKFKAVMKNIGYRPSDVDPCLFINEKSDGTKAFVIIYVDDGAIFGTHRDIQRVFQHTLKQLMKYITNLDDFHDRNFLIIFYNISNCNHSGFKRNTFLI